jgi:creatine kinase
LRSRGFATKANSTTKSTQFSKAIIAGTLLSGGVLMNTAHADGVLSEIKAQLNFIEGVTTNWSEFLTKLDDIRAKHPGNLMAKHFDATYFLSLSPALQKRLYKIVASGLENPDSAMGCYAMQPNDYDVFKPYLDRVIRDYHKIDGEVHHVTNWEVDEASKHLDLTKLGLGITSMRVRVGRNLESYPLPGAMNKNDRVNLERDMIKAFKKLMEDKRYGGNYYSLTPDTEYTITDEFYKELVKKHIMFKDMANDPYLNSAGISSDWPYGRGCYVSEDKGFIVWVGEEDHLRIMCMKKGTVLNEVFDRLSEACNVVETNTSKFAHSKDYGFVTSCPTNLGTGMRASVHIKVPNLTADGTEKKAKEVCKPLGLSVRGVGGEHTPIGADGTVDISPSARLCIEEQDIIKKLYKGIELLLAEEKKAAKL